MWSLGGAQWPQPHCSLVGVAARLQGPEGAKGGEGVGGQGSRLFEAGQ